MLVIAKDDLLKKFVRCLGVGTKHRIFMPCQSFFRQSQANPCQEARRRQNQKKIAKLQVQVLLSQNNLPLGSEVICQMQVLLSTKHRILNSGDHFLDNLRLTHVTKLAKSRTRLAKNSPSFYSILLKKDLIYHLKGREPWSSGYGKRLMFQSSWV